MHDELHKLNIRFTECLSKEFLPDFMAGKIVSVDNYCLEIRNRMLTLDKKLYPKDDF